MNDDNQHIYYDLNIINSNQNSTSDPPRLTFNDIRNNSLLSNPSDYFLSVVRFNLQTANSLPVFIPEIQLNGNLDPNYTIYSFTMKYKGVSSSQRFVFYQCENSHQPPSMPIGSGQNYNLPYYYISSFDNIIDMFNNCLDDAFSLLSINVGHSGLGLTMPTVKAPFLEWDYDTSKFILNADVGGYDMNGYNNVEIYCNTSTYMLLSGLRSKFISSNSFDGCNYQFIIKKDPNDLNVYKLPTYNVIQCYQQYSSATLFSPIASLVFTSALIPVIPTNTSKPTVFGHSSLTSTGNNSNISSMITDFEVQGSNGYGYQSSIEYIPSGEYRLIDMCGSGNTMLQNIEISVFWKDSYSNLHPLYLQSGCRCDLKIMFRKKTFQRN